MRFSDVLRMSSPSLKERKLRVALTALGIVIGVASIIALMSQAEGIRIGVISSIEKLSPTTIILSPRGPQLRLSQADVAKVSSIPNVEAVVPVVMQRVRIYESGTPVDVTLLGIHPAQLNLLLGEVKMVEGTIYSASGYTQAVIGYNVAYPSSGGTEVKVGQPLIVEWITSRQQTRLTLQVTGILRRYGASPVVSIDDAVLTPLEGSMKLFNKNYYDLLLVKAVDVDSVDSVTEMLEAMYGGSARIIAIKQVSETVGNVINQFGVFIGSIAAISLTVAGLGIVNIMTVSVLERTKEIGVLKAVGFKDRHILLLILSEALIIGCLGGVVGVASGVGVSYITPYLLGTIFTPSVSAQRLRTAALTPGSMQLSYTPMVSPSLITLSFAIALTISLAAGIYPAWRAAKMDPIKALKHE
ncbi:MAG: FtsX-like permease family protein [Candidatus Nezhaarchaeales archaeon]